MTADPGATREAMSLRGSRVAVLGGTGVIGSRLVERLIVEHGAKVAVLVKNWAKAVRIGRYPVEMVNGDVVDGSVVSRVMSGADVVIDCTYPREGTLAQRCRRARLGAERIAETALRCGTRRVVHLSSITVYGGTLDGVLEETAPRRPRKDPYAASKLVAEETFLRYGRQKGLPVVVLQPTIVYGPFAGWTVGPLGQLSTGTVVLVNGGAGLCNAVYLDDVVDAAILGATKAGVEGEAFLISAKEPVTWREFFGAYQKMLRSSAIEAMSAVEVRRALRNQARRAKPLARLLGELRSNAELRGMILRLPGFAQAYWFAHMMLPSDVLTGLKGWVRGAGDRGVVSGDEGHGRHVLPSLRDLDLFETFTRVSISKSARLLDYRPRYDLGAGMALTAQWAAWARLV